MSPPQNVWAVNSAIEMYLNTVMRREDGRKGRKEGEEERRKEGEEERRRGGREITEKLTTEGRRGAVAVFIVGLCERSPHSLASIVT